MDPKAVEDHFRLLPAKYVLYTPLAHVQKHLEMIKRLLDGNTVVDWIAHPQAGYTDLLVVTRDHPGLFAQIAGGLAAFNLTILSAQLNTRQDKIVCDVFQVSSRLPNNRIPEEDFPRIEKALKKGIAGQWNFVPALQDASKLAKAKGPSSRYPPRLRMDNDISPSATVIEIQAEDRVGLGYQIASALAELQLNIMFAKLATEKAQALDVFYVQEYSGKKVRDPRRMATILERLQARLSAPLSVD
jgi:[protein-PII] uridylyltransferase